jgi:hypothetical protein
VDLLFVIDNSGSMSEEQVKLNNQLAHLVQVLTSGDFDGAPNADGNLDFVPVSSLRLGVTSVDLGVNSASGVKSCGDRSFLPTEQDNRRQGADNVVRPFGDNAQLLSSTAVALAGVSVYDADNHLKVAIAPRPECGDVAVQRFLEFDAKSSSAAEIARQFGCIAELGVNGCGFEQQLESTWKALAPSTDLSFSRGSGGQGAPAGANAGFVRDDAILAVILVTDEEDCSSPDASADIVYSVADNNIANVLCTRNPDKLHPAQRYIDGLKSLKSAAYQDRIIFAGIVGVPVAANTRGMSLDQILALPDMQIEEQIEPGTTARKVPRPACIASQNAGSAAPARRIVEVAKGFGTNGVITSICEDDYAGALNAVIAKIADKLSGECLPRSLQRKPNGLVECTVLEIKRAGDAGGCDPARGRVRRLDDRVINGVPHVVCEVAQLPALERREPGGVGWYYDDFSVDVAKCKHGKQRVAFASQSPLEEGASATITCYQAQAQSARAGATGEHAVGTPCLGDDSGGLSGDALCHSLSTPDAPLVCVYGSCQLSCSSSASCPAGRVCSAAPGVAGYCENPTCPIAP